MDHGNAVAISLQQLRASAPLVHSITNYVAMDVTANALLAIGASPAMVHAEDEVADFVTIAQALVINIGTLSAPWVRAMNTAAERAVALGKPWVLDPVGAGATPYRTEVARTLSRMKPTVIRGNASEILALAGGEGTTKGVDSTHTSEDARELAQTIAREFSCVVAVTGETDYITDAERTLAVSNGHPMMTKVTALGCTATALIGAFLALGEGALSASAYGLAVLGLCGEIAARESPGPGTLRWRLLDALHTLDDETTRAGVRIEEI